MTPPEATFSLVHLVRTRDKVIVAYEEIAWAPAPLTAWWSS